MIRRTIQVKNQLGLHARAAAKLVRLSSRFSSEIYIARVGYMEQVDSKSILGILMIAASAGTRLELSVNGEDESEAAEAIIQLFESRFGEESVPQ